ncbi:MAG: hypothetical protein WAV41_02680 [Microgenomates group bacterium]
MDTIRPFVIIGFPNGTQIGPRLLMPKEVSFLISEHKTDGSPQINRYSLSQLLDQHLFEVRPEKAQVSRYRLIPSAF